MKHIVMALALSAIPATAFAQDVRCHYCDHIAPYFKGQGGFIGTVADGVEEVTFVASCGNVLTTGEAQVDGDTAAQLFSHRNGLACDQEGGALEIAGLKDGGWYWITDEMNSAVGNLVLKDVLENDPVELTSAGDGVMMSMGMGAVFVKETSTGRVGILPNILPAPPMPAVKKCGFSGAGTTASPFVRVSSECAMGDGGTITLATWENTNSGTTSRIHDKGAVRRPGGSATLTVEVDLWGNGSGHFVTDADATGTGILLGQPAVSGSAARAAARLTGVSYTAKLGSGVHGTALADGVANGGITMDTTTTENLVTFAIVADDDYCSDTANETSPVSVTAVIAADGADDVMPAIKRNAAGVAGRTSFTVICPSRGAPP